MERLTDSETLLTRPQSPGEEIANAVSHGFGLLASLIAAPVLVSSAVARGGAATIFGAVVFAAAMVLLFLASTIYHALPRNRAKNLFQIIDHVAIFLLIAGTYTPFTLGVLRGAWGWTLFVLVWALAIAGVLLKIFRGTRHPRIALGLYLSAGWLVVIAIKPLLLAIPIGGFAWLLAGGLSYTSGLALYAAWHIPYHHCVWHLFVMAGTACHYVAVMWYAG